MKQNLGELTSLGGNVYQDKHNRQILFDRKNEKFYLVEKDDERKLNILSQRYILAITVFLLVGFLMNNWIIATIVGVVIYAGSEYYYKKKFIPSLLEVYAEVPTKEDKVVSYAKESKGRNIARTVAGLLLPVLLVINDYITIKEKGYDGINTIALIIFSVVFTIYAIYVAIISLKAIAMQKGNKK